MITLTILMLASDKIQGLMKVLITTVKNGIKK